MKTSIADPDRREPPAPLRDRPGFGRAGVTETLSAGAAVVLGVIRLKLLPTFVTILEPVKKKKKKKEISKRQV